VHSSGPQAKTGLYTLWRRAFSRPRDGAEWAAMMGVDLG
jgi:hypothetical protein